MTTLPRLLVACLALAVQACEKSNSHAYEDVQIIDIGVKEKIFYMTDPMYPSDPEYEGWVDTLRVKLDQQTSSAQNSLLIWGGDNLAIDRSFDWQIYKQRTKLEIAMESASDRSVFVSGNHDYNQIRAWIFGGTNTIRKFDGNKNRILVSDKLAIFLYDAYHFESDNYSYDVPVVNQKQLLAYESRAEKLCLSRKCIAVIGSQFLDHESLQDHWQAMYEQGLELAVTGDSHESRFRQLPLQSDEYLPFIELSPSAGAKLPLEIDFSGRPSGVFEIDTDKDVLRLRKIYLSDFEDASLLPEGICTKQESWLTEKISIDFLLDNQPCIASEVIDSPSWPPITVATFEDPYNVFAMDIYLDIVERIDVSVDDLERGVILYSSSKADSKFPIHGFRVSIEKQLLTLSFFDRWLREVSQEQVEFVSNTCALSIQARGTDTLVVTACEVLKEVKLNHLGGVYFGAKRKNGFDDLTSQLVIQRP